jgi:DNA-nicking Smr family endonuclease
MQSSGNADSRKIILQYLDRHGVRDKDAAVMSVKRKKTLAVGATRRGSVRATIDLHGMTTGPALAALRDAIDDCVQRGVAELLVIHGYGLHSAPGEGGVLKVAVRQYLEAGNDPRIRRFTTAKPKDGGEGATLIWLR